MHFHLGLCDRSIFDTKYSWTWDKTGLYYIFRGYQDTMLLYNESLAEWRLEIYGRTDVYARVNSTRRTYPFGTLTWEVHGDEACQEGVKMLQLNVHGCNQTEYNCDDGSCVAINLRCDGKIDCPDKTDEVHCNLFEEDASYIKESAPLEEDFSTMNTENLESKKVDVDVEIDVLSFLEISEVDGFTSIQLNLRLTW